MPEIPLQSDHDLLIELRTEMRNVRNDIRSLTDGTTTTLVELEARVRSLEDTRTSQTGRSKAFNWVGSLAYAAIALAAGLLGSFIQAGKL